MRFLLEDIREMDIINPRVEKMLEDGVIRIDEDHRIRFNFRTSQMVDMPWVFTTVDTKRQCARWADVYFNVYNFI